MIEPKECTYKDFPETTAFANGIQIICANLKEHSCRIHTNVKYAEKDGMSLHLNIIEPAQTDNSQQKFPLIMYVQGSGWMKQDIGFELAQLSRFARRGYVIAIIEYRPSDIAPFPAQIKDTKTAIRFMINNADFYHADAGNIIIWGDSSGGHTAVMTGVTLDCPELDDEYLKDEPLSLKAVIDYYGPTDISKMNDEPSIENHSLPDSPEGLLIGGINVLENQDRVKLTVPMNYLSARKKIPPFLIIHGSKDRVVPFGQSVLLYEALKQNGKVVNCYQLKGADHGGSAFWTEEVLDIVNDFILRFR